MGRQGQGTSLKGVRSGRLLRLCFGGGEFFCACSKAEAIARLNYTNTIARAASDGDWRAAMEYLKRRDPENWGDRSALTVGNPDGTALAPTTITVIYQDKKPVE